METLIGSKTNDEDKVAPRNASSLSLFRIWDCFFPWSPTASQT